MLLLISYKLDDLVGCLIDIIAFQVDYLLVFTGCLFVCCLFVLWLIKIQQYRHIVILKKHCSSLLVLVSRDNQNNLSWSTVA